MKKILSLIIVLLSGFSYAGAQSPVKRNAFETAETNKLFNSETAPKRVDSRFPVLPEDATAPLPQTSGYVRPDKKTRMKRYISNAFGVSALISAGGGAAYKQITNSPKEWHRTTEGFARRFASNYAQGAIGRTITFGINEAFKLDDRFERSTQKGLMKRARHVVVASLTTRTAKGGYLPDFPHFIGSYAGNIIAKEAWYPPQYTYKDGLKSGTISIFTRLGMNFIREFIFH